MFPWGDGGTFPGRCDNMEIAFFLMLCAPDLCDFGIPGKGEAPIGEFFFADVLYFNFCADSAVPGVCYFCGD